jgi:hypothetical protein
VRRLDETIYEADADATNAVSDQLAMLHQAFGN